MSKIYEALKRVERERQVERAEAPVPSTPRRTSAAPRLPFGMEEEYRRLRASLVGLPDVRTILVTASRHGEGTTKVAVGLAAALASEQGPQVLLMEANLRSPSLAERLALPAGPGVSEYLAGHATPEALVQRRDDLNLSVVHAGTRPAVIDTEQVGALMARLSAQFDYTILDAPPVNRYADAAALAPKADAVILVAEADRTTVVEAETAKRNLERVGARILGVVLHRRRVYVPAALEALL